MPFRLIQENTDEISSLFPDKQAVTDGACSITYKDILVQSNKISRCLLSLGLERGDRVAICMSRSVHYIEAMVGVLKADTIYVPIMPETPEERRQKILKDCRPRAIIGDDSFIKKLPYSPTSQELPSILINLSEGEMGRVIIPNLITRNEVNRFASSPLPYKNDQDDVACVLYTSGSTGNPKGVMITHRNIIEYISWAIERIGISNEDRVLGTAPFHFDMSLFDVYGSLMSGATLCIAKEKVVLFPKLFIEFAESERISIWKGVSSLLMYLARTGALSEHRLKSLRVVLFSGEVLPTKYLMYWMEMFPDKKFFNAYGPTEATGISMYYRVDKPPSTVDERIPIGKPCENTKIYLLDEKRKPVAPGEPGELYIGGACVTKGYLSDPKRTAEVFIDNSFDSGSTGKIYKTGDFARLLPDGNHEFLGRRDNQVKYMGFRIELSDIEQSLVSIAGVRDAGVILVETPAEELTELIAYIEKDELVSLSEICMAMRAKLPLYMIPKQVFVIARLPRSDRGKIDRASLGSYHKERSYKE